MRGRRKETDPSSYNIVNKPIQYNVAKIDANGNVIRLWNGWSATTGRHIASFCGLNKKEFLNLPLNNN